jgi:PAS domain S-box-containing protein
LVIDDNPAIHDDFRKILGSGRSQHAALNEAEVLLFGEAAAASGQTAFELDSAFQGTEGLEKVEKALQAGRPYAMAFVDVRMPPGWDGVETIQHIWEVYPELQIVMCTAYADYSWDEITAKLGKPDSMVILKKPFDNIEVLQLSHALTKKWLLTQQAHAKLDDLEKMVCKRTEELQTTNAKLQQEVTERCQAEAALRVSEERFSRAFLASPIPKAIQTLKGERYVDVNDAFLQMTGYRREEVIERTPQELQLWDDSDLRSKMLSLLHEHKSVRNLECHIRTKDGERRTALMAVELFNQGVEPYMLVITQDISEHLNLENQLRQAQKMEAVGQLAAGVAHDFNNLLTVIQGHVSLRLANPKLEAPLADSLKQVLSAAERASALTSQLLAFSRKQIMQPRALNLNELIDNLTQMLRRLIGEDINLQCEWAKDLPCVFADPSNLEQVLMNLTVNARDAMTNGGQLVFRTTIVQTDSDYVWRNPEARAGKFVCLSVTDNGCGMDPVTRSHAFEPFFTTKGVGKGTGMGLATVYGIVKQHNGWIEVSSLVGQGTTFQIFLPVTEQSPDIIMEKPEVPLRGGQETILLVEDEPLLRELVQCVLEEHGYVLVSASSGAEALQIWNEHNGEIDLLLTDMVMPGGMTGRQLAEQLTPRDPNLKVIFTSGYSQDMVGGNFKLNEGVNFLPKPYQPPTLVQMVRNILDDAKREKAAALAEPLQRLAS